MPTPELPLVVLLRAPGGEPWEDDRARIREILTSSVIDLGVPPDRVREAVLAGDAIAITSPRAAQWLASLDPGIPRGRVFCSGSRTARILSNGGWEAIAPAAGSGGEATARQILSTCPDAGARILYVHGRETAGTFERELASSGRTRESLVVYAMEDRAAFDSGETNALEACDAVAFLAPSCLRILEHHLPAILSHLSRTVPALAGPTTASALRSLGWLDVREASEPSCAALLSLLDPGAPR